MMCPSGLPVRHLCEENGLRSGEPSIEGERSRRQYSFAEFTLDLEGGFLRRGGEEVPLSPTPQGLRGPGLLGVASQPSGDENPP